MAERADTPDNWDLDSDLETFSVEVDVPELVSEVDLDYPGTIHVSNVLCKPRYCNAVLFNPFAIGGPSPYTVNRTLPQPVASLEFWLTNPKDAMIYTAVCRNEAPNFRGARIPLNSGLNLPAWRGLLQGYPDRDLIDLIIYGFPVGYTHHERLNLTSHITDRVLDIRRLFEIIL